MSGARRTSPSVARNAAPILSVLKEVLPQKGRVLEIASGTGEHAMHFARALAGIQWQTSDPDPEARASIEARIAEENLANVLPPLDIDVRDWSAEGPFDAVVAINMIHIAPWPATAALFDGARRVRSVIVFLYGPFMREGRHTAPSNAEFDAWLKTRDSESGVRNLEDVVLEASRSGFACKRIVGMPANNLSLVFAA
ncbi:MAG TPA: DUF938 domain-containing protein [Rhizomicrobium sp.]|nr:DUF938 domain-containing protein [Rhizomicrobium sp.]